MDLSHDPCYPPRFLLPLCFLLFLSLTMLFYVSIICFVSLVWFIFLIVLKTCDNLICLEMPMHGIRCMHTHIPTYACFRRLRFLFGCFPRNLAWSPGAYAGRRMHTHLSYGVRQSRQNPYFFPSYFYLLLILFYYLSLICLICFKCIYSILFCFLLYLM